MAALRFNAEDFLGPYDPGGQPVYQTENDLLLGVFGWNLSSGCAITEAVLLDTERRRDHWKASAAFHIVKQLDEMGCEFEVPFGRWLGHGGTTRYNEDTLDMVTVAAGPASVTSNILLPSTSHIGYGFHPAHFAKWGATIDHISNGRWALNVVAGWVRNEVELFGREFIEHDLRYDACHEFVTLLKLCWEQEEPFDFDGRFFKGRRLHIHPKPARKPRPLLVQAGQSTAGLEFAGKDTDWLFTINPTETVEELKDKAVKVRAAADKYDRHMKVVTFSYNIWEETDQEAEAEHKLQAELIDELGASWWLYRALDQPGTKAGVSFAAASVGEGKLAEKPTFRDLVGERAFEHGALGLTGHSIFGGYDSVAEHIRMLYEDGDQQGQLFSWIDPLRGIHQLEHEIIPRLRKMGLRK